MTLWKYLATATMLFAVALGVIYDMEMYGFAVFFGFLTGWIFGITIWAVALDIEVLRDSPTLREYE